MRTQKQFTSIRNRNLKLSLRLRFCCEMRGLVRSSDSLERTALHITYSISRCETRARLLAHNSGDRNYWPLPRTLVGKRARLLGGSPLCRGTVRLGAHP